MKYQLALLATFASLTSLVFAQDGASGDGGCDPCDESCDIYSKRSLDTIPRMLEFNDTSPWGADEISRWRKPAGGDIDIHGRLVTRAPGTLTLEFNCGNVPEICLNMCYGWNCKGHPTTLTINRATCTAARKSNACGSKNPNYCSAKSGFAAGYSCDEYPFASTNEGTSAASNAATRCVPKGQNSSQGGSISGLYKNGQGQGRLADGTAFQVSVGGSQAGYCSTSTPNCGTQSGDNNSKGSQM